MNVKSDIEKAIKDLEGLQRAVLEETAVEINVSLATVNAGQRQNIQVDSGDLLASTFVREAKVRGKSKTVSGVVGADKGGKLDYSRIVHEIPGENYKYLENPATAEQGPLERRLRDAAIRAARRALG